jgi:predicted TIM-barrel enzyme
MDFKNKEIIGMIHLAGPDTIDKAMDEIKIYEEEGLSGIIVENYHGTLNDVVKVLERLTLHPTTLEVGINILPLEYEQAYKLCNTFPIIKFIQLDHVAGKYTHGQEVEMEKLLQLWVSLQDVKILGGVWPKYYTPIEGSDLKKDIIHGLFTSDAIVVTGAGTGMETPLDKIKQFRTLMDEERNSKLQGNKVPLIVGAGLTAANVKEALTHAQGAIVGSAFKPNGRTTQMVDRDLVRVFMDEVKKIQY